MIKIYLNQRFCIKCSLVEHLSEKILLTAVRTLLLRGGGSNLTKDESYKLVKLRWLLAFPKQSFDFCWEVGKVTKVVGKGVSKVGSKVGAAAGAVDKKLGGHVGKKISKLSEVIANGVKKFTSETVGAEDIRVLILGFDKAGKTTLLNWISEPTKNHAGDYGNIYALYLKKYDVKWGKTLGYNSKRANYKNSGWHIWDIGGDEEIRGLWPQFYMNIFPYDALVFVVDSTDTVIHFWSLWISSRKTTKLTFCSVNSRGETLGFSRERKCRVHCRDSLGDTFENLTYPGTLFTEFGKSVNLQPMSIFEPYDSLQKAI